MPTIFFYDVETTGTDPAKCGIHQISGMFVKDGVVKDKFNYRVKPKEGCLCSPVAMDMAGYTYEEMMASDLFEPMDVVFKRVLDKITYYCGGNIENGHPAFKNKILFGGYNIHKFDNEFLRQWFEDNHAPFGFGYYYAGVIDVMLLLEIAVMKHRTEISGIKLEEAAWLLNISNDPDGFHDACFDVEMCYLIYCKLIDLGCIRPIQERDWVKLHTVEELEAWNKERKKIRWESKQKNKILEEKANVK